MATLLKITYTRPTPEGADHVSHNGKPSVRFPGRDGKPVVAPLTADGTRCRIKSAKWYGQYADADGVTQRVALSENRTVAQQMLNELLKKVELAKVGIRDPYEASRTTPVGDLLAEFGRHQSDNGITGKQTAQVLQRCGRVFAGCHFALIRDLDATKAERYLASRRATEKRFGIATSNHFVSALKTFGNWLVTARRAAENPFRHLKKLNGETDIRKERRVVTGEELERLIAAAERGR